MALEMVPWKSEKQWKEANRTIRRMLRSHAEQVALLTECASRLTTGLASVFPLFEDLCRNTCGFCPEPCCSHARVWFDFKDLLFLNIAGLPIPPFQARSTGNTSCFYLGARGCLLNRIQRPWICTWYMCPTQTVRLHNEHPDALAQYRKTMMAIKCDRRQLETLFIDAVT